MIKVGILFGGRSRECEVSFAGGRTVFDNLDKALFAPVPIFIDPFGNFCLLHWQLLYKGTIRDFYPAPAATAHFPSGFQAYAPTLGELTKAEQLALLALIGTHIPAHELGNHIDFAFLTLHGPFGEDGALQGLLAWHGIPYSGAGIFSSALGIDKATQARLFAAAGQSQTPHVVLPAAALHQAPEALLFQVQQQVGFPCVVKATRQGSSIGISVVQEANALLLRQAIQNALFIQEMGADVWAAKTPSARLQWAIALSDIRSQLGYPVRMGNERYYAPHALIAALGAHFAAGHQSATLTANETEAEVLVEQFITGREFSCVVLQNLDGTPIALPPTEIVKTGEVYEYRAKYLPGLARKVTPMAVPDAALARIKAAAEAMFTTFSFEVYARIDGFLTPNGNVLLNDPNTTSGMMPSSFFFHQAAEIGLAPKALLTFIIHASLQVRAKTPAMAPQAAALVHALTQTLQAAKAHATPKKRVAVVMGGYSSERHISVESGRNVLEKLASSTKYAPFPVFLSGTAEGFAMHRIPTALLLKDNADDIAHALTHHSLHPFTAAARVQAAPLLALFADIQADAPSPITLSDLAAQADTVFIALHGRPGEDGALQAELERIGLPYNGSGIASSQLTIDKFATLERLRAAGMPVARHQRITAEAFAAHGDALLQDAAYTLGLPLIAKPVDDGCSSAVKKITSIDALRAYAQGVFRDGDTLPSPCVELLNLKPGEEFPAKRHFLVESLIGPEGAACFMEVTVGLLTRRDAQGELIYEILEPSEAIVGADVLSLEEKFLAGEGQNITPARFAADEAAFAHINECVKQAIAQAARLLGIEGYARIDAFVRIYSPTHVETLIIEANSLPGMTPATCIFQQAALHNYTPYAFIDAILEAALQKQPATVSLPAPSTPLPASTHHTA